MGGSIKKLSVALLRLRLFLLAALLSVPAFAGQDWTAQPIGPFGGLNDRDNSFTIPADHAQAILNVNITEKGKSVEKRKGFGAAFTLSNSTAPVHGDYFFYNSTGSDIALFFNDRNASASINGQQSATIYSTATVNSIWQCSDYLGYAYCVNSNRDGLFKTAGLNLGTISVTSTGTMVASAPTRLAMAGFSSAPSRIDFSAETDFATWGTGSLGTSAVQLTVNSPGSRITHIVYAFGRLMWFKENSFGYILIGNQPSQTDWVIKTISNSIGTLDNSSTFEPNDGLLYFRGQDAHIYTTDGYTVNKISRDIPNSLGLVGLRIGNNVTLTSGADWNAGTFTGNSIYVDTETVSGNLQTTFPDNFSTYRDGSSSTKKVWNFTTVLQVDSPISQRIFSR